MAQAAGGARVPHLYAQPGHMLDGAQLQTCEIFDGFAGAHNWYADDYTLYTGPQGVSGTIAGGWKLTAVGLGTVLPTTNFRTGRLDIITTAAANDNTVLQQVGEPWAYVVGKRMWALFYVEINTATTFQALFGLAVGTPAPFAALPTDGLFFNKLTANSKYDFHARNTGVSTTVTGVDPANIADATPVFYGFTVSDGGRIDVWTGATFNQLAIVGSVLIGDAHIPTVGLTLHYAVQATTTSSRVLRVHAAMIDQVL
jgi:hypothetical protein